MNKFKTQQKQIRRLLVDSPEFAAYRLLVIAEMPELEKGDGAMLQLLAALHAEDVKPEGCLEWTRNVINHWEAYMERLQAQGAEILARMPPHLQAKLIELAERMERDGLPL